MDRALRRELAAVEDTHWWFEGRRRILRAVLGRAMAGAPVLEVGCGNGANLTMLAELGPVTGIEPDPEDRARAESRGVGRVLAGSLPDALPVEQRSFGTVLALDVIEHIEDDVAALGALRRVCRPDGLVVVTVPAGPWLWSRHDVRNGHFRRYTRPQLAAALGEAGLRIARMSHFNMLLLPPIALVRTAGRVLGLDDAGTGIPPAPVNRALTKLLAAEARLLTQRSLPAGVSLLALCRPA